MRIRYLLYLVASLFILLMTVSWSDAAWYSGWNYRKSHVINAASGAGTNYQVKITAHYGAGTDSEADVYLNNHSRTNFGDIRFTGSDGATLLDYWMESKTDSDNAVFWVEVADDLSSTNQTIYIYYGKADATTTSNVNNTFIRVIDGIQPVKLAYSMDENTGTITYDQSGNAHNGTLTSGAGWGAGKWGYGVTFDGTNDYVTAGAACVPADAFSIIAWVNRTEQRYQNVVSQWSSGSSGRMEFYLTSDSISESVHPFKLFLAYSSSIALPPA